MNNFFGFFYWHLEAAQQMKMIDMEVPKILKHHTNNCLWLNLNGYLTGMEKEKADDNGHK